MSKKPAKMTIPSLTQRKQKPPTWLSNLPPREQLIKSGPEQLTDIELLAIILSTGIKGMNVVDWSKYLLEYFGSLHAILTASEEDMVAAKGIGPAKYTQLKAIGEIAKRYMLSELEKGDIINSPTVTKRYLRVLLGKYDYEVFIVLFLDNQHQMITYKKMFKGSFNSVTVYPREIAREALKQNAAAIILAHNHPSGVATPSQADITLTRTICTICEICDIKVLDHIIIGNGIESSFAELGLLP
ncbi:DNA repair protein RadC [Thorsellia anophelis DSM 18579]|uniref:DNA repair protein RadC n=2 Tax=Thorsellia anophelis TaxID=336804 RepID=A0A1I0B9M0_9GAMM|nr:DNA repair protein RadC [Thorsellia anophelis DSM 18579]